MSGGRPAGVEMRSFGEQLKEARETRGVSLDAVAKATRIPLRHLEAIERSDLEGLPRGPFGQGYIKAYAGFLGISPEPMLKGYHAQERQRGLGPSESQRRTLEELSQFVLHRPPPQQRGLLTARWTWTALALAALGILGTAGWLLVGGEAPKAALAPSPPPAAQSPGDTDAAPEALDAPVAPEPTPEAARAPERPAEVPAPTNNPPNPDLAVSHSGVGTGVESLRLVGRADRFVEGTTVSFWTRVLGGRPGDLIHHIWIHEGQVIMRANLEIGGSHWRTFSRRELPPGSAGQWAAEARSPDGRVLARVEFLCVSIDQ
jgi:cytoskeletal protein RodZ